MINLVSLKYLNDYNVNELEQAVRDIFTELKIDSKFKPKMKVLLKVCLSCGVSPDLAETTHPAVVQAFANVLSSMGVKCIVADCLNKTRVDLDTVYYDSGLLEAANLSKCELNRDFSTTMLETPNGVKTKTLTILNVAKEVDAIINIGKLKIDDKLGYLGASANVFGLVPNGMRSLILNRLSTLGDFNNYIIDMVETLKDKTFLNVVDGIVGLEANKTQHMMCMLAASENAYSVDGAVLKVLDVDENKTIIKQAVQRELLDKNETYTIVGEKLEKFVQKDFVVSEFDCSKLINKNKLKKKIYFNLHQQRVCVTPNKCKGCSICSKICPTNAISMRYDKNGELYAEIDYNKCVFCNKCFNGCPYSIVKHKTPLGYKLLTKNINKE